MRKWMMMNFRDFEDDLELSRLCSDFIKYLSSASNTIHKKYGKILDDVYAKQRKYLRVRRY
jgi:hypothetical protein